MSIRKNRFASRLALIAMLLCMAIPGHASQIDIATIAGFLDDSTGLLDVWDTTATNYFSTLDANNIGTFGWTYTNTGSVAQTGVTFFGFLDADIDRALYTALDEYGNVVSQSLPPGAASDALEWTSFQIDEPGFTTGTIIDNLLNGILDNTNHVPPGTENDTSLALGIPIGTLNPGQSFTATFQIGGQNIGGLSQTSVGANYTFYFNGDSTNPATSIPTATPEPSTWFLVLMTAVSLLIVRGSLMLRVRPLPTSFRPFGKNCGLAVVGIAVASCGSARAQSTVIGFDGLQCAEFVENYYAGGLGSLGSGPGPNYGITFSPNAQILTDAILQLPSCASQISGGQNTTNMPSPLNAVIFQSGPAATMNVTSGFTTGFSFYYASPYAGGFVNVWSGANGTGTLLTTLTLPSTPGCAARPNYCSWPPIGITFNGTAHSVDFGGSAGFIVFDSITLGAAIPGTPPNLVLVSNLTARFKDASVDLVWTAPTLAPANAVTSYNLYRRTDSAALALIKSGLTALNYTDSGLTDGTTYYYVVRWVNSAGLESPNSTEISATPTSFANQLVHKVPPTILSNPVVLATVGQPYSYAVSAANPNPGDTLTYSLPLAPSGMTVDPSLGVMAWTPTPAESGSAMAKVRVQDSKGYFATQMYQIIVQSAPPTSPPVITSNPSTSGTVGQPYHYQVLVADPNPGAFFTYALASAPSGMSISPYGGLVQWVPVANQLGPVSVSVKVQDQFNLSTTQAFSVTVAPAPILSPVFTSAPIVTAVATQPYSYQVTATDPNSGQTLSYALPVAPTGMTINSSTGLIQWTPTVAQEGTQTVLVGIQDALGASASQQFTIQVTAPLLPPTITIASPAPNAVITQLTSVIGTIADPNGSTGGPLTWSLGILKPGATAYTTIASGTGPITNAVIGQIDPTLLSNNVYPIQITALKGPYTRTATTTYSVAGNLKLGNFTVQFTDLSIPLAGIPITITRRYDSLDTSTGDFGAGWRLALPGQVMDSAGGQAYTVLTRVYVTRPDGKREGFTFAPFYDGNFLGVWSPAFTADPGVTDTLTVPADALFYSGGAFFTVGGSYLPTLFTLKTTQGVQYLIDEHAGLQKITDTNGNTLTVTPGGLISSTGVSVGFQRDSQNRITKITEPGTSPGTLQYAYDVNGNLITFTDQNANATQYSYQNSSFPNYLTSIVDPLGRPTVRTVYNASGQIVAQCDANGNPTTLAGCATFTPNSGANLQTIVNGRGYRTDLLLDANGNVLTERHWLDSVNHVDTVRTYDANSNMLTQTDPAGNVTTNTYDGSRNLLSTTDPLGHVTKYTYNSCNKILTTTDPAGNVTTNTYDAACDLLTVTDALNHVTTYAYNTAGQQTDLIDAVGNHWIWAYDPNGYLTSLTDPFGNATTYTFGATGDLVTRIDRNGRRIDFQYDGDHHPTQEKWNTTPPRLTTYAYNAAGQLTSAIDPDSALAITYTTAGKLSTVDNNGTPNVPRVFMTYGYDADSNVTSVQDSLGGTTGYLYDQLDRLSQVNQSGTGVNPKRANYQYDNAGFLTQLSRFADLAGTQGVANTVFQTDCDGCPGRITAIRHRKAVDNSVIDDLTFVRDSLGNITSSTDADGTHVYGYNTGQQLLSAVHSNASMEPNELYSYDPVGNRLTSHISSAYSYTYMSGGAGNRLAQDQQYNYQYDNEGNLISTTSRLDGTTTSLIYDYRNRLVQVVQGTSAGVSSGHANYVFDSLNRRIQSNENGTNLAFVYDGQNPTLKLGDTGTVVSRRFYARSFDSALADDVSGTSRWFFTDHLGSVRDIATTNTTLLDHYTYDSFGRVLTQTNPGTVNDIGFTGREGSVLSDVSYFRARSYEPRLGRFLQEDPIGIRQSSPSGYAYATANPINNADPTGLIDLEEYGYITLGFGFLSLNETIATKALCNNGIVEDKKFLANFVEILFLNLIFAVEPSPTTLLAALGGPAHVCADQER
jgi:RHS repeat-associated protein